MTRKECKDIIQDDIRVFAYKKEHLLAFWAFLSNDLNYARIQFLKHLRWHEYYRCRKGILALIGMVYHKRRKNAIGLRLNWEIPAGAFSKGLQPWHPNIVVNDDARIGKNALLHGNNCIGRKGEGEVNNLSPRIGDNLNLGFGASIIGGVVLGDNVIVGCNAVVIDSYPEGNVTLVGVPAKPLKRSGNDTHE